MASCRSTHPRMHCASSSLQIVCGNRAGALTILLDEHHRWPAADALQGEERPHFIARSLHEVKEVLQQEVRLIPPTVPPQPLDDGELA